MAATRGTFRGMAPEFPVPCALPALLFLAIVSVASGFAACGGDGGGTGTPDAGQDLVADPGTDPGRDVGSPDPGRDHPVVSDPGDGDLPPDDLPPTDVGPQDVLMDLGADLVEDLPSDPVGDTPPDGEDAATDLHEDTPPDTAMDTVPFDAWNPLEDLCAPCIDDDECGGTADLCIEAAGFQGCSIDCSGDPDICPSGFACGDYQRGGVTVGRQCLPTGAFIDCAGICGGTTATDCAGACGGNAAPDDCDVCSGGTSGHVANADKDCTGVCFGSAVEDCNGVCDGTAVTDCAGVCDGSAAPDDCGICSGGTSGHVANADKDCAGTCFGSAVEDCKGVCDGTAVTDCAGVCDGSAAPDDCGVCSGGTSGHVANADKDCAGTCFGSAEIDCASVCDGSAVLDDCGVCSGGTSGHVANADKDCAGVCFGGAVADCKGVCNGTAVIDCAGVCGGIAVLDDCGVCSGGTSGHVANADKDCAGVCFGGAVADCKGVCNGTAEIDCAGVCGGIAALDDCGVCSGGTSGHVANADKDCAGTCFGTATRDCAGVCQGTAALDDCGVCSGGTSGHVANADKDCLGTCFGDAVVDCFGVCDGGAVIDRCGVCGGDGLGCADCAGVIDGSAFYDVCGVCSGGTSGHVANSDEDCAGVCFGAAAPDDCGVCSGGTSGHVANADKDCAGVCFGAAVIDCAGVCDGAATIDRCGTCDADPANDCIQDCAGVWGGAAYLDPCGTCDANPANDCIQDCAGVWGGTAFLDQCAVCSGGTTGHVANSDKDCLGVCFGSAVLDPCGTCDANPANDCVQDCAGVWGGTAAPDDCEVCSGGTSGHVADSDKDCTGVCFGHAAMDDCGVCSGGTSGHIANSDKDCAGVCFGDAVRDCADVCQGTAALDDCGVCSGGTTGHVANSDKDCTGLCFGTAALDDCGICSGGTSGHVADSDKDCAGVCFGDAVLDCAGVCDGTAVPDDCGVCSGGTTGHIANSDKDCTGTCFGDAEVDCEGVCQGAAFLDLCGVCSAGTTGHVANSDRDCAGVCFGNAVVDCAGVCEGMAALDDCGVCSGGTTGHVANSDKDCAGVCFGDAELDCAGVCEGGAYYDNCGVCDADPGNDCAEDCEGVLGGTAVVDDCGVCSGGTTGHVFNEDMDACGVCWGPGATHRWTDADGDGYGDPATGTDYCTVPDGTADNDDDCDDGNAWIKPGVAEVPGDGVDQDCDGDEACFQDADGDGYWPSRAPGAPRVLVLSPTSPKPAVTAFERLRLDGLVTYGEADFLAAFGDGSTWDLLVLDVPMHYPSESFRAAVDLHLNTHQRPLFYRHFRYYADTAMHPVLDAPSYSLYSTCTVAATGDGPADLFGLVEDVPAAPAASGCQNLYPTNGVAYARISSVGGTQPALVSSRGGLALIQGFSTPAGADGDMDGIDDAVELWADGIALQMTGLVPDGLADGWLAGIDGTDCAASGRPGPGDGGDCDDDPASCGAACHPGATEVCDDYDTDCDGVGDTVTWYRDADGDGFGDPAHPWVICAQPDGYVANDDDCDDDPLACGIDCRPGGAEVCDTYDNDCNGLADDVTWYLDADGDGHGAAAAAVVECPQPAGYVALDDDCDDDPLACGAACHPGASEVCDGWDNDCDLATDDDDPSLDPDSLDPFYRDDDGDGWGEDGSGVWACLAPDGYVPVDGDCEPYNAWYHPGAMEVAGNGIDEDCDGHELCYADGDHDGFWPSKEPDAPTVLTLELRSAGLPSHIQRNASNLLGLPTTSATDEASFLAAYGNGDAWDVLMVAYDIEALLTQPSRDAIATHVVTHGRPIVLWANGLSADTAMMALLGIEHLGNYAGTVQPVVGSPVDLFDWVQTLPSPRVESLLTPVFAPTDDGGALVELLPSGGGAALGFVVATLGGRAVSSDNVFGALADLDADGIKDATELQANALAFALGGLAGAGLADGWLSVAAGTSCAASGLLPPSASGDCNDGNDAIHPGAADPPDLAFVDADCDGIDGTAAEAYFVSLAGVVGNPGTMASPFATIAAGLAAANGSTTRKHVFVAGSVDPADFYDEVVTLPNGVSISGGYDPVTWQRSGTLVSRIWPAASAVALKVPAYTGAGQVQMFDLRANAASGADASSRAIALVGVTGTLVVEGCTLTAGAGAGGGSGAHGADGSGGEAGGGGGNATVNVPGAAGVGGEMGGLDDGYCYLGGSDGGNGGGGGDAGLDGANGGSVGGGGAAGGAGGTGVTAMYPLRAIAGDGSPGAAGATVTSGANGTVPTNQAAGEIVGASLNDWRALSGGAGVNGTNGKSGGGGGGGGGARHVAADGSTVDARGRGGGGGGGGGGGCGGEAGTGGGGGGGSIGVLAIDSPGAVIRSNAFTMSAGGGGGSGGDGGLGGARGLGGTGGLGFESLKTDGSGNPLAVGGDGAVGGNGTRGGYAGAGTGGGGGMSVGIVMKNSVGLVRTNNTFTLGTAGVGGQGGQYGGTHNRADNGAAGIQSNVYTMP